MARMIRLIVAVAAERLADVIDTIRTDYDGTVQIADRADGDPIGADMTDETPADRAVRRTVAASSRSTKRPTADDDRPQRRQSTRIAGRVLYTPVGTKREITRMLDDLRGVQTMKAFVLRDLAKHPGSTNREVRERIAPMAKKAGLSVESVDNVIWQQVDRGVLSKRGEA